MSNRKFKWEYSFDRIIKVTEVSDILEYAHFNSINKMIERGDLRAYRLPHAQRRRVLESGVLAIKNNFIAKRGKKKGRPLKYPYPTGSTRVLPKILSFMGLMERSF